MQVLDLFNTKFEQDLKEGAVDQLEQRRIDDLNAKMKDLVARAQSVTNPEHKAALKREFEKVKSERDSYYRVKEELGAGGMFSTLEGEELDEKLKGLPGRTLGSARDVGKSVKKFRAQRGLEEGEMKRAMEADAERMSLEKFVAKYGDEAWIIEFWNDVNGPIDEQGIPGNLPPEQVPGKEDLLKGRGRTYYEAEELDEQEGNPFGAVQGPNLVLLQNAWTKQLPHVSLQFPNGQAVTVYKDQVYSIFKALEKMNPNKQVEAVQKFLGTRQDFLMWLNSIKQHQIPPKVQKAIKSKFAQPEPGQLDLGISEDSKKKDKVTTPTDTETELAIKLAKQRHPTAKSDLAALVKDRAETEKSTQKEIEALKAANEKQDQELKKLEKETDALNIATSTATPSKVTTAPAVSAEPGVTAPVVPTAEPGVAQPIPTGIPTVEPEPTVATAEPTVKEPTKMKYRKVEKPTQIARPKAKAIAAPAQAPTKDMGPADVVPQIEVPGIGSVAGDMARTSQSNKQRKFAKQKPIPTVIPTDWEVVHEGWQDFNKVEPYAVCLAGKPVKKFDYYEEARRFHDNWKAKLYREGNKEKADKITLMPILDEHGGGGAGPREWHSYVRSHRANEAANPAQQAAIAIAMKKAGKKPKHMDEAEDRVDPIILRALERLQPGLEGSQLYSAAKEALALEFGLMKARGDSTFVHYLNWLQDLYNNRQGIAEHGGGVNSMKQYIAWRKSANKERGITKKQPVGKMAPQGRVVPKGTVHGKLDQSRGVIPTSSFHEDEIAEADREVENTIRKLMAPAYEEETGGQFGYTLEKKAPTMAALREKFHDDLNAILTQASPRVLAKAAQELKDMYGQVAEGQTDYQKRRQRERDVDAGKPVAKQRQSKQTDYQKRRAQDKKDMDLGEESYMESVKHQGISDTKLLEAAAKIDLLAKSFK